MRVQLDPLKGKLKFKHVHPEKKKKKNIYGLRKNAIPDPQPSRGTKSQPHEVVSNTRVQCLNRLVTLPSSTLQHDSTLITYLTQEMQKTDSHDTECHCAVAFDIVHGHGEADNCVCMVIIDSESLEAISKSNKS